MTSLCLNYVENPSASDIKYQQSYVYLTNIIDSLITLTMIQ
ncbi:conserved hypothetical protein [Staphylococcus argenteus]|uniref:Uncharacterized protein n=1 Tax=Staphylococcus argenteus TaxID=985002 RepID=A0A7U7PXH1_9STAP|nr:conserved hypothetical protein [Staphylococcus argenteus]CRI21576.1 conserved hypothetical protein [Staphylococcus argenteus]